MIFLTGASIFGQLFAASSAIADEVPPLARILVELLGFVGAVAGLISALMAITGLLNYKRLSAAGNHDAAAAAAAAKAQKYGANLLLLIGILSLLCVVKIGQAFFLGK